VIAASAEPLTPAWAGAFAPPPDLTVSEWADAERVLPETSAEPGRWRTARVPWTRGIMDALNDPAVETVVLMGSAQIAKTEVLLNVLGYSIAHDPAPALLVQPTITMAEAFSKDRLAKMIRDTPALVGLVREGRVKGATSTVTHKLFPGGYLALAGANSPASLAQRPVRLLVADDVDRFPPVVSEEGDPLELAIKRTTTFWNRKIFVVSTPTLKGGRIDTWYQRSDQRRFLVPCPGCGRRDALAWHDPSRLRVVFDERDPATARLECPAPAWGGCGRRIEDHERLAMIAQGAWSATTPTQEPGLVGFHVWEAYSPWVSLPELVAKFLAARARGRESLRVFVNTSLGEGWEDQTQRIEPQGLLARREDYGTLGGVGPGETDRPVEVPARACCLTAGVDTQDDRFEVLVLAWGPGEESWVVDWHRVPGDPKRPETKAALLEALTRRYQHAGGAALSIHAACLDSGGHRTDDVYDFVLAHQHLRLYATIGRSGLSGKPLVGAPTPKRYGRTPRPVPLYTVNVDDGKAAVLSSLRLAAPGPGHLHLPAHLETIDESFVAQLTAEQLVTRHTRAGIAYQVWVQIRPENHALDCAVLARAALRLFRPNLLKWARDLGAYVPPTDAGAAPPPAEPRPLERRVARSAYLNR
jgi:phage terminase large subunit GpA-like protein